MDDNHATGSGGSAVDEAAPSERESEVQSEQTRKARATRQAVLAELGVLALGKIDLQSLLDLAVERVRESLAVDACSVLELMPGGESFLIIAGAGWSIPVVRQQVVTAGKQSQAGFTLLASEPVIVKDVLTEKRFGIAPSLIAQGVRSVMSVVMHGRERPFGVFAVVTKAMRDFAQEEVDYFQAAANVLASAVERLRTEEELRRSEANFRNLIEHAPEGILIHSDRVVRYVNRMLLSYFKYDSPDELIDKPALTLVHPEDREIVSSRLVGIDRSGIPAQPRELRFVRRDGSVLLAESVGVPIVFNGQPAIAAMIRDITGRKKMEAQLSQSERLSSLGTLAAGVAHEINNPLMYVLGNLDLLKSGLETLGDTLSAPSLEAEIGPRVPALKESVADLTGMLDHAREGGERVRRIVADLKVFSRDQRDEEPSAADVRKIMGTAINLARNEIRHRAQLVLDYQDVPRVMVGESKIGQVFLNLLLNAAQAIPDGAAHKNQITVRTATDEQGRALIEVHDTGMGIPAEIQDKLFDPFFTTKPVGVGTGLGLAICHNIITSYGGTIAVESEPMGGTCFRVTLPAATVQKPKPATAPAPISVSGRRGRVLIIDDEPFVAGVCRRILASEHDAEVATAATDALALIESGKEYDVIFCDLMMPEMSGMEFFEELSRRHPDLLARVVFLSGGAFSAPAVAFREQIPNTFLDKPVSAEMLRETVRQRLAPLSDCP